MSAPLILGTNSIKDTGFNVDNSLRLNQGDDPDLKKTIGTPTSSRKFSVSCWVKLSNLGVQRSLWGLGATSGATGLSVRFQDDDTLDFFDYNGSGNNFGYSTNQVFRDVSAWSHFLFAVDTEQSTAHNRVRIYHNGVEIEKTNLTDNPGDPSVNADLTISSGHTFKVGDDNAGSNEWAGYIAEFVYIDGLQLTPSSFGEFDEDTGIWKPIDVSGLTFGTNGFYLDFEDSSNLGNDANGGTDLTETNIASTDQTTDTCTNNFATFNPLINNWTDVSEGNLKVKNTSQAYRDIFSTVALTSGKWYVECRIDTEAGGTYPIFGIADASDYSYPAQHNLLGRSTNGYGFQTDGNYYHNNADAGNWSTLDSGDIIGFYLDLDSATKTLKVYKNGTSELSININNPIDGYYFGCSTFQADNVSGSINFGNPSFTISSGNSDANGYGNFEYSPTISSVNYYAINTKNLAEYG